MNDWQATGGSVPLKESVSRRAFLKRASAITFSVPAVASLLAACGGDDDGVDEAPASTPTQASVPTVGSAGGTPTVGTSPTTSAAASPTTPTTAASPTTAAATATTSAPAAGAPKRGGTLLVQGNQEIASLHPDDAAPRVHWVIVANLHDGLVEIDKDYQIEPILATSFEAAADGLSYTFHLREGVKFHDGEEFTAEDVKHTFDWHKDPASAAVNGALFAEVASVETPDDYTAVVRMSKVNAAFMALTAPTFILPEHYHGRVGKEGYAPAPIGTGPFKLKEWKPAEATVLEAFDDYFRGRPNIDFYTETNVPEESVRAIALETGESDHSVWPIAADDNLRLMESDQFVILRAASASVNHFPLNNTRPALAEKEVRQAMMYALDRDSMVNNLEKGLAVKATGNITPALQFYYEPDVKQYDYEPDTARSMLDAAGWTPGPDGVREKYAQRLSFTCVVITGDQRNRAKAELAQANLAEVGIEMKIEEQPVATILTQLPKGEMDASIFNWTYGGANGEPDARTSLRTGATRNFSQFSNARVDELLDAGVATTVPEERKAIYGEIQQIVAEEVPFLFIMYWEWIEIWNKRVKGLPESSPNTGAPYRLIYTYWIDDEA